MGSESPPSSWTSGKQSRAGKAGYAPPVSPLTCFPNGLSHFFGLGPCFQSHFGLGPFEWQDTLDLCFCFLPTGSAPCSPSGTSSFSFGFPRTRQLVFPKTFMSTHDFCPGSQQRCCFSDTLSTIQSTVAVQPKQHK